MVGKTAELESQFVEKGMMITILNDKEAGF